MENYRVFVFEGGSRSSKTYSLIQFFIYYALTNKHRTNRIVIARKRATWLYSTVWNDFNRILTDLGLDGIGSTNKTLKVITLYTTTFEFIGLDDVQKLHGLTTDIFWINEAMEATKDDFDQLEQRTSRFSILDYNPSAEEHWIYDNVCTRDDCYFDHSTMLDNPFIPENSRRKILSYEPTEENYQQGTADERKWKIYGLGMRAKIEGLVFNGYEIIKEIPEEVDKRWYCVDYGFSNDPTAIAEVGYNGHDLFIDEHCYKVGMLTDEIRDFFIGLEKKRKLKIISESADPRMVADLRKGKYDAYGRLIKPGLPITPVRKYNG